MHAENKSLDYNYLFIYYAWYQVSDVSVSKTIFIRQWGKRRTYGSKAICIANVFAVGVVVVLNWTNPDRFELASSHCILQQSSVIKKHTRSGSCLQAANNNHRHLTSAGEQFRYLTWEGLFAWKQRTESKAGPGSCEDEDDEDVGTLLSAPSLAMAQRHGGRALYSSKHSSFGWIQSGIWVNVYACISVCV